MALSTLQSHSNLTTPNKLLNSAFSALSDLHNLQHPLSLLMICPSPAPTPTSLVQTFWTRNNPPQPCPTPELPLTFLMVGSDDFLASLVRVIALSRHLMLILPSKHQVKEQCGATQENIQHGAITRSYGTRKEAHIEQEETQHAMESMRKGYKVKVCRAARHSMSHVLFCQVHLCGEPVFHGIQ